MHILDAIQIMVRDENYHFLWISLYDIIIIYHYHISCLLICIFMVQCLSCSVLNTFVIKHPFYYLCTVWKKSLYGMNEFGGTQNYSVQNQEKIHNLPMLSVNQWKDTLSFKDIENMCLPENKKRKNYFIRISLYRNISDGWAWHINNKTFHLFTTMLASQNESINLYHFLLNHLIWPGTSIYH